MYAVVLATCVTDMDAWAEADALQPAHSCKEGVTGIPETDPPPAKSRWVQKTQ